MMLEFTEYAEFSPEEEKIVSACPLLRAFIQDLWEPKTWSESVNREKASLRAELSTAEQIKLKKATRDTTTIYMEGHLFNTIVPSEALDFSVETLLLIGYELGNKIDIRTMGLKVADQVDRTGILNPGLDRAEKYRVFRDTCIEDILLSGGELAVKPDINQKEEVPAAFSQLLSELDLRGFTGQR